MSTWDHLYEQTENTEALEPHELMDESAPAKTAIPVAPIPKAKAISKRELRRLEAQLTAYERTLNQNEFDHLFRRSGTREMPALRNWQA